MKVEDELEDMTKFEGDEVPMYGVLLEIILVQLILV